MTRDQGHVLLDVVTAEPELVVPPRIKLEQAKGFSLFLLKAILNGRGDEVAELARGELAAVAPRNRIERRCRKPAPA